MSEMKKTVIIVALLAATVGIKAQQGNETYNESVVVKGSYTPVIEQAEKISFPAQITDTLSRMEHAFHYNISPSRLRASYTPTRIRAARVVGEPATKLYNNYLRLGMGNYWSPLADLYWSSTRDRLKTYGISLNHRSSWDKLKDYGPNQFGNTNLKLFGKYIVGDVLQLASDVSYEHDHNLYYGFTDSTLQAMLGQTRSDLSLGDYRASYNVVTWNVGVRNMELDANKLGYTANLRLGDLWGRWGQNEMNLNLNGDVHYGFPLMRQYKGIAYLHAEWDFYRNLYGNGTMPLGYAPIVFVTAPALDTSTGSILKFNPYVEFLFRGLQFRTGATVAWDYYSNRGAAAVGRIFPDVTVSKKLMNDNLVLSLAAIGGMEATSLNAIRLINPYVAPDYTPMATSHYDFVFHTRWTLSRKLEANAEVSYSLLDNEQAYLLATDFTLNNVYDVYGVKVNRLTVGGDVAFVNDEMIAIRAGGHYYHNDASQMVGPGHLYRPDWDALVRVDLNYHYKWFFHLAGQLLGRVDADGGETLPMRYGVDAQVEYRHNRALSFFLQADNLAFQRYWYWSNYPSQRGLFLLGLTYTIPGK